MKDLTILLGEYDCDHDEYIEFEFDAIQVAVEQYEKRYRTEVVALLLEGHRSSRYGSICGHGQTGYRLIETAQELESMFHRYDNFDMVDSMTDALTIVLYDHDGSTTFNLMPITQSKIDANPNLYEDVQYGLYDAHERFAERLSYLKVGK